MTRGSRLVHFFWVETETNMNTADDKRFRDDSVVLFDTWARVPVGVFNAAMFVLYHAFVYTHLSGNVQMAVLLGLFDHDNYNWRSMTSPRISGLFNPHCLKSGADNLMMCYPGDNTYSGAPLTEVSLIHPDNQFYSVTTTVAVNGKNLASSMNLASS